MAARSKTVSAAARTAAKRDFDERSADGRGRIKLTADDAVTRPLKAAEAVARDLVRHIVANRMSLGDSLPGEAAMIQSYGVSRESLREGLRLLEVQGLITIRRGPGGGPVVGTVDSANLGRVSTLYYQLAGATYAELFEAWILSESILAERVAALPDLARRLAAMQPYLDAAAEGHDVDGERTIEIDEFIQAHSHFHAVIASLVDNRVLELSLQTMGHVVSHHVAVTADPRVLDGQLVRDHAAVARAVIAGDSVAARAAMKDHIEGVVNVSAKRMDVFRDEFIEWQ